MHPSALAHMSAYLDRYLEAGRHYDVLDFGSFVNKNQQRTHRELLTAYDVSYTGVDIQAGRNVDIQMTKPYTIPVRSRSQDVVLSGQVFEHVPYPFVSMLEITRVLRPGGYLFVTVPSRGHHHSTYDLWRFYPDSMLALGSWAGLDVLHVATDWPRTGPDGIRLDYSSIRDDHYWGDTTAAMQKPRGRPSPRRAVLRAVSRVHANALGPLPPRPQGTRVRGRRPSETPATHLDEERPVVDAG